MKKQITYSSDEKAIEKLGYLAKVFYIEKAVITKVVNKGKASWRLEVNWK
jgi:hypothetical protein